MNRIAGFGASAFRRQGIAAALAIRQASQRHRRVGLLSSASSQVAPNLDGNKLVELHREDVGPSDIARQLGISRATVYRAIAPKGL